MPPEFFAATSLRWMLAAQLLVAALLIYAIWRVGFVEQDEPEAAPHDVAVPAETKTPDCGGSAGVSRPAVRAAELPNPGCLESTASRGITQ